MSEPRSFVAYFQNGPDAPVAYRVGKYVSRAIAQVAAADAVRESGTVPEAAGWVDDAAPAWASKVVHRYDPHGHRRPRAGQLHELHG